MTKSNFKLASKYSRTKELIFSNTIWLSTIDELINSLEHFKQQWPGTNISLKTVQASWGDTNAIQVDIWQVEDDETYNARVAAREEEIARAVMTAIQKKEADELALYRKLHRKYGNK